MGGLSLWHWTIMLAVVLLLVTYLPWLSLWLPRVIMG